MYIFTYPTAVQDDSIASPISRRSATGGGGGGGGGGGDSFTPFVPPMSFIISTEERANPCKTPGKEDMYIV